MRNAGLGDHQGPCGIEELKKIQAFLEPEYQIKVFSAASLNFMIFKGPIESEKVLHLYHDVDEENPNAPGHFMVCKSPHVLFNNEYWCDQCNKPFDNKDQHKCVAKCFCCYQEGHCKQEEWHHCPDCRRWFKSRTCYDNHKSTAVRNGNKKQKKESVCDKVHRCQTCNRLLNWSKLPKVKGRRYHKCGERYCFRCEKWGPEAGHLCYMRPPTEKKTKKEKEKEKKEAEKKKEIAALAKAHDVDPDTLEALIDLAQAHSEEEEEEEEEEGEDGGGEEEKEEEKDCKIFFDFECVQEQTDQAQENDHGPVYEHKANLCVALKVCSKCKEDVWKRDLGGCENCGDNEFIFRGENTQEEFCRWLLSDENKGALCVAHYSRGYDSQIIMEYMVREVLEPKTISRGQELMMMEIGGIRIIDSMNFLPIALADVPGSFGLTELKKGFFPHYFNTWENQNYVGPWPDKRFYDPDHMKEGKRKEFLKWHQEQVASGKDFRMEEEVLEYCRSDVDILMRGCLKFEELFMQVTKVNPFAAGITIASACMHVFRKNFLKPYSIGIVPHRGYRRRDNQSVIAQKYFMWLYESEGLWLQHAGNQGEAVLGNGLRVDGYDPLTKTAYEFHGCCWHGCPKCMKKRDKMVPGSAQTMESAYQRTLDKSATLRSRGLHRGGEMGVRPEEGTGTEPRDGGVLRFRQHRHPLGPPGCPERRPDQRNQALPPMSPRAKDYVHGLREPVPLVRQVLQVPGGAP